MGIKVGYARTSGAENIDLQLQALRSEGCEKIFTDENMNAHTIERDGLSQAISIVGTGDILVVWKLDRLGRSLGFVCELIDRLGQQGIGFISIADGIDTTAAGGKIIHQVAGALMQLEFGYFCPNRQNGAL